MKAWTSKNKEIIFATGDGIVMKQTIEPYVEIIL
jgi:hypothetical protein